MWLFNRMSESTLYPMSIRRAATVPSDSSIPSRFMMATGMTMSENAETTTATEGTNVRNITNTSTLIPTKATATPPSASSCVERPKLAPTSELAGTS
jgi:hypothetical protein